MTAERDDDTFAQLVDAIGPYLGRIVIVGGWAHRLFRNHALAQAVPYAPLMTRDTDVAIPLGCGNRPNAPSTFCTFTTRWSCSAGRRAT